MNVDQTLALTRKLADGAELEPLGLHAERTVGQLYST